MAIVTSFELNCVRQPIPFNIQTLPGTCADAAKRKNFKSHLKTCPLLTNSVNDRPFFVCYRSEWTQKARETNLHEISNARVRERVPYKPLPHAKETHRDGACSLPHRATNQNMVPESKDEIKERNPGYKRVKRTGETSASSKSSSSCCGGSGGGARAPRALSPPRYLLYSDKYNSQSAEHSLDLCL